MLPLVRKHQRLLFYFTWFTVNMLQAGQTELIDDEAYYWVYSRFPAWGYFDHPPMIAILIKAGFGFFHHELGVRLFIVMMNTATIFIIQELTEKKDDLLFYAVAGTVAVAQIGGIIAAPDIPLLFFVALFFWLYKRFLYQMNLLNSILVGAAMALMLYSKYHGVLIIFATILSNPSLLRKYQAYIAVLVALLLFAPHLYWQYDHGFPSILYHLFERNASEYKLSFTIEYILGQIALAGPLMGWLLLWAAFVYKPASLTERALKFSLIGLYGFFLLSTLKGRVEANWTIPAFIPLIVLSHQYFTRDASLRKWLYKSVPVTLVLILLARVYMLSAMPGINGVSKTDEIHANRIWVNAVHRKAGGSPVIFLNSYQFASKYWFYSGNPSMSLNGVDYRRNNYNFWPIEDSLFGKKVMATGRAEPPLLTELLPETDSLASFFVDNYFSFSRIQLRLPEDPVLDSGRLAITGELLTPITYLPLVQQQPYDTASLYVSIFRKKEKPVYFRTEFTVGQIRQAVQPFSISVPVSMQKGEYSARMGISTAIPGYFSLNSTSFPLKVP